MVKSAVRAYQTVLETITSTWWRRFARCG